MASTRQMSEDEVGPYATCFEEFLNVLHDIVKAEGVAPVANRLKDSYVRSYVLTGEMVVMVVEFPRGPATGFITMAMLCVEVNPPGTPEEVVNWLRANGNHVYSYAVWMSKDSALGWKDLSVEAKTEYVRPFAMRYIGALKANKSSSEGGPVSHVHYSINAQDQATVVAGSGNVVHVNVGGNTSPTALLDALEKLKVERQLLEKLRKSFEESFGKTGQRQIAEDWLAELSQSGVQSTVFKSAESLIKAFTA